MPVTTTLDRMWRFDALVLTAAIWFLGKVLRYAFPPLFGPFQASYGVSNTELGFAFTGFMLVYAAVQFPSGVLGDRVGSVTVITAGVGIASLGALSLVVDFPFVVLVGAMLVMGAGTGAHKTVAVRLLARVYPTRIGRALGFLDTVGAFGGVVAPIAIVLVASYPLVFVLGWRTIFLVAGLVGAALGVAFWLRVPERLPEESGERRRAMDGSGGGGHDDPNANYDARPDHTADSNADESARSEGAVGLRGYIALFREWRFTVFVLATVLFSFAYNGIVAFAPLYLIDEAGLATSTAGLLYSALFAVSVVQLVTGEISDRIGTLPVIVASLGVTVAALVSFIALTATGSALALGAAIVAVGLGAHGYRPVRGAYLMEAVPMSIAGGSLGVVRTLLLAAGATSPAIVGFLSETVGFRPAFSLLATAVAGATVLCFVLLFTDPGSSSEYGVEQ